MVCCDAHAHIGSKKEQKVREKKKIKTFLCGTNPSNAKMVEEACANSRNLFPTYGLHPWYANQYKVEDMLPFIQKGCMLGEIGMDRIWCHVPLEQQKYVFEKQLALAKELQMPVVLHTKGCEKEVLDSLNVFASDHQVTPMLVHWYSAMEYLQEYIALGCFFTIGPDVYENEAVQEIVKRVPLNRLLVETDGMEAVRWASNLTEEEMDERSLPTVLTNSMRYISDTQKVSLSIVGKQMKENFEFLASYCFLSRNALE